MRHFRNPRYAPEALERKLHPSGISPLLVAAEVYVPATTATDGTVHAHGEPGDPVPTDPTNPGDGTDPAPPPGNGDPPKDTPGTPVGPGEPG